MNFPKIPVRPAPGESENAGGLVKSRIQAFANVASAASSINAAVNRIPPSTPAKPKDSRPLPSLTSKNIHDAVETARTMGRVASTVNKTMNYVEKDPALKKGATELWKFTQEPQLPPKLPPSLPKPAVVRQSAAPAIGFIKESTKDISVKDVKSKFETASAAISAMDKFNPNSTQRQRQNSFGFSEFNRVADVVDRTSGDLNNNGANIKSLRAQLESKLTMWSPDKASQSPGQRLSNGADHPQVDSSYQQRPVSVVQPNNFRNDQFPSSSSFPDGFHFDAYERPILPTLAAKSKPPPRPPPCLSGESHDPFSQQRPNQSMTAASWDGPCGFPPSKGDFRTPSPQEATATVMFDFAGEQSDELSSRAGDSLVLKHDVDEDWYYAYNPRTARTGIIPKTFVDVVVPLPNVGHPNTNDDVGDDANTDGPRCYTLHDFVSNVPGDLSFLKGEVIKLISRVSNEWLEGESHDGRRGIFPVNFVEIIEDLSAAAKGQSPKRGDHVVTALYDFSGENPGDLPFMANAKILVKARVNEDWLYGQAVGSGQLGIFPATFVDHSPADLPLRDSRDAF